MLNHSCPLSAFSTSDPNLVPQEVPQFVAGAGGVGDQANDQPANPANTINYKLDMTDCLAARGLTWHPGEAAHVTFGAWGDLTGATLTETTVPSSCSSRSQSSSAAASRPRDLPCRFAGRTSLGPSGSVEVVGRAAAVGVEVVLGGGLVGEVRAVAVRRGAGARRMPGEGEHASRDHGDDQSQAHDKGGLRTPLRGSLRALRGFCRLLNIRVAARRSRGSGKLPLRKGGVHLCVHTRTPGQGN
jgi:hypothetical protein